MDSTETANEPRAKRQKTRHNRSAAFERLKQLKGKGSKNKYEVSDVDNVYEVVDEKEYSKNVLDRQDDDWIVDDDGSGYVEDGREIFDDDLDSESIASASRNTDGRKKKKNISKIAGKGSIQAMLSNMPEKKKEMVNLDQDDILSDVLSGMDDNLCEKSHSNGKLAMEHSEEQIAKNYLKNLAAPKPGKIKIKTNVIKREKAKPVEVFEELPVENTIIDDNAISDDESQENSEDSKNEAKKNNESKSTESHPRGRNYDDVVAELFAEADKQEEERSNSQFEIEREYWDDEEFNPEEEFCSLIDEGLEMNEMFVDEMKERFEEEMDERLEDEMDERLEDEMDERLEQKMDERLEEEMDKKLEKDHVPESPPVNKEEIFRFYWWDAFEDSVRQPGTVFLFGKTYIEATKSYESCCIIIRNIERKIYLLPRPFLPGTDIPVKMLDVYNEFSNKLAVDFKIRQFRSRKVTKKYAFDPDVPLQSEYLEVRYLGPAFESVKQGNTFSRIFGIHTSFLEIFLLEKKIKGPCWLEIRNATPAKYPISWCKHERTCLNLADVTLGNINKPPPPMVVATINMRTVIREKTNEIVMIGCLVHKKYHVDKEPPKPPFQQHFCVITNPSTQALPLDMKTGVKKCGGTEVEVCESENTLLNTFLDRFEEFDADLVVGHDLVDFHLNNLCERITNLKTTKWSRFGKIKRSRVPHHRVELMTGRLICDLKISARELIKSRSYDLDTLCQTILNANAQRPVLESSDIVNMFSQSSNVSKLVSATMQDTAYITKIMYELNVMPLALQITKIAGNTMSKTLQGGRAQRNEFLLLHAFTEKDYICPDKRLVSKKNATKNENSSRKKPTYSGGLVLDPKVGFYDKFILLMDFNSLYPSIIQEYNICFTTMQSNLNPELMLSSVSSEAGILPTEIRKLVETRKAVKQLMKNSDLSNDLKMQYDIRQLALKLTANSMYGCLGFENSRFFAKHLASLITMKGRDILMHTRDMVQTMGYDVIYGDTDSIMINTNIVDYDQVFKIGNNIKQSVNKTYKQVELDIDGVFKYMLLLKKKKYAAITVSKDKKGGIVLQQELKGLDIVRRDWSMLASEVGKMVVNHILSDLSADERIENIQAVLGKIANELREGKVPTPLLVISKQLTKKPDMYTDKVALSHVMVALRYNKKGGKPLGPGDTVPYVICEDGSNKSATQRAYHIEEFKRSDSLKIDINYYLAQQIHPVVSRLCQPIEGLDAFQIANYLGIDAKAFKKSIPKSTEIETVEISAPAKKFRHVQSFDFVCLSCEQTNSVSSPQGTNGTLWLEKCVNMKCNVKPVEYLYSIDNKLIMNIKDYVQKYYEKMLTCEDPYCTNQTDAVPLKFANKYPVCTLCHAGVMYRTYTEGDLYEQICFYKYVCDISKLDKKIVDPVIEEGYSKLKESIDYFLKKSAYSIVDLTALYSRLTAKDSCDTEEILYQEDSDYESDA